MGLWWFGSAAGGVVMGLWWFGSAAGGDGPPGLLAACEQMALSLGYHIALACVGTVLSFELLLPRLHLAMLVPMGISFCTCGSARSWWSAWWCLGCMPPAAARAYPILDHRLGFTNQSRSCLPGSLDGTISGPDSAARSDWPPVNITHCSYQIMIGIGLLMALVVVVVVVFWLAPARARPARQPVVPAVCRHCRSGGGNCRGTGVGGDRGRPPTVDRLAGLRSAYAVSVSPGLWWSFAFRTGPKRCVAGGQYAHDGRRDFTGHDAAVCRGSVGRVANRGSYGCAT